MSTFCSVCGITGNSICMIDNHVIDICKNCGMIVIQSLGIKIQMEMPLAMDNNLYAVARGIADIYTLVKDGRIPPLK